jgi:hypothetical protein
MRKHSPLFHKFPVFPQSITTINRNYPPDKFFANPTALGDPKRQNQPLCPKTARPDHHQPVDEPKTARSPVFLLTFTPFQAII